MSKKETAYRAVLFVLAGVASFIASAWGLLVCLWTGGGSSLAEWCFVLLPSLSFPVFLISLWSRKVGLLSACLIPLGTFVALFVASPHSRGNNNAISDWFPFALGVIHRTYPIDILMAIMPVCLYFVCVLEIPTQSNAQA
jgi:hypothetical protein